MTSLGTTCTRISVRKICGVSLLRCVPDGTETKWPPDFEPIIVCFSSAGKRHQDVQVQRPHLHPPEPVRAVQESGQPLLPGSAHLTGTFKKKLKNNNNYLWGAPVSSIKNHHVFVFFLLSDYSRHHHFALVHDTDSSGGGAGNHRH